MCKKSVSECRSGKDFVAYASHKGAEVKYNSGSHVIIKTEKGSCVVPVHDNKDIGTGLRCKIIKTFILIGLGIMVWLYLV